MTLRSKILTVVTGAAALAAVLVATPSQNEQAKASSAASTGTNPNQAHSWGP